MGEIDLTPRLVSLASRVPHYRISKGPGEIIAAQLSLTNYKCGHFRCSARALTRTAAEPQAHSPARMRSPQARADCDCFQ